MASWQSPSRLDPWKWPHRAVNPNHFPDPSFLTGSLSDGRVQCSSTLLDLRKGHRVQEVCIWVTTGDPHSQLFLHLTGGKIGVQRKAET